MEGFQSGKCVSKILSPLRTVVTVVDDGSERICHIASDCDNLNSIHLNRYMRNDVAQALDISRDKVVLFVSHNHCRVRYENKAQQAFESYDKLVESLILPEGRRIISGIRNLAKDLLLELEEATVHWSKTSEERITYNRKGRRIDGKSYFIREEDRSLLGEDFSGKIDSDVYIICFKRKSDQSPICFWTQFTGHPVTAFHPEHEIFFWEFPGVACKELSDYYSKEKSVPVAFMQGCAGDINSKFMLSGDVEKATSYGKHLGQSFISASKGMEKSVCNHLHFEKKEVLLPLSKLPSKKYLEKELKEIDDFLNKLSNEEDDTYECVGLNFPKSVSPEFRSFLVRDVKEWNEWAIEQYKFGHEEELMKQLPMNLIYIKLGDIAIVGMPCEPFSDIGRQIKKNSPFCATIPCGYTNTNHGYIPDSHSINDREYMSSFHRYTKYRAPFSEKSSDALVENVTLTLNEI